MTDPALDLQTLAERLDEVEKKNHKLKNLGIALALLGIIRGFLGGIISARIFSIQMTGKPSEFIEATDIVLRDQNGKIRATLVTLENGTTELSLYGKDGKGGVALSVTADGVPHLFFQDRNNKRRLGMGFINDRPALMFFGENAEVPIFLNVNENGSPQLIFAQKGNKDPSIIMSTRDGGPYLSFLDDNGQNRITLRMAKDENSGGLNFYSKEGKNIITIGNSVTHTGLKLFNNNGKGGIGMTVKSDGSSSLGLLDADGSLRTLLTLEDGRPSLKLYDEKGIRAAMGSVELVTKSTGTETKRPLSSLVFFNDKGEVIWKAPPGD